MAEQKVADQAQNLSEQSYTRHWRNARVVVDYKALSHNLAKAKEYAPHSLIMAVIKANAYGHGMLNVAAHLQQADLFAVSMAEEAFALRAAGCLKPILVLHGFNTLDELEKFASLNIASVVQQQKQLTLLQQHTLSTPLEVWLKVDTGMNRLGISAELVEDFFAQLRQTDNVSKVYVMSHLSCADEPGNAINNKQIEAFIKVTNDIDVDCSLANSAAIMRLPKSHFEVVRPGIMLYGSSPFSDISAIELGLQAAMQFESELLDIKPLHAGEAVGYGGTFVAENDMNIGVVAVGYGDGYPRHAQNGTPVWINGQCCKLVGRVSMDSICIDLTGVDASSGDRVVLWGKELSVDDVARASNAIAYELLCNAGAAYLSYQGAHD